MKNIDKLREEVIFLIEQKIKVIKEAKKAHHITNVIDWFDQDLFDKCNIIMNKIQKGKYIGTNEELDKFYEMDE